jgi:chemotaxis protein CheZ
MSLRQVSEGAPAGFVSSDQIPAKVQVAIHLDRIFDELAQIRQATESISESDEEATRENDNLWSGIATIHGAIVKTRHEIASLHAKGVKNEQIFRATDELDAVVLNTESATETILGAAETIDAAADRLMSGQSLDQQGELQEIRDQAISIFEACNFQDLSGQRIRKVVALLQFIETRVASMIAIWHEISEFREAVEAEVEATDADLLNGPPLDGDEGIVSQDDIDSLFK